MKWIVVKDRPLPRDGITYLVLFKGQFSLAAFDEDETWMKGKVMDWIKVKDKLPADNQKVKFRHQQYEFTGFFRKGRFALIDPLSEDPAWYFTGTQNGGRVTTIDVSEWKPIENES